MINNSVLETSDPMGNSNILLVFAYIFIRQIKKNCPALVIYTSV